MSAFYTFRCSDCGHEVEASDELHRYILDDTGTRHFYYHPCEDEQIAEILNQCKWARGKSETALKAVWPSHVGSMWDVVCCACGEAWRVDELTPSLKCHVCDSSDVVEPLNLGGKTCFKCKRGTFPEEPDLSGNS